MRVVFQASLVSVNRRRRKLNRFIAYDTSRCFPRPRLVDAVVIILERHGTPPSSQDPKGGYDIQIGGGPCNRLSGLERLAAPFVFEVGSQ